MLEQSPDALESVGSRTLVLFNALRASGLTFVGSDALDHELERFRLWASNLGLFSAGHASLQYRLRDAEILQSAVRTLFQDLNARLIEIASHLDIHISPEDASKSLSGVREIPSADRDEYEDDYDETEEGAVEACVYEVIDILDRLFRIATKIRNSGSRPIPLKALSFQQFDPDTGVDVYDQYSHHDLQHMREILNIDGSRSSDKGKSYLVTRLARANTTRRRIFAHWKRHSEKAAFAALNFERKADKARPEELAKLVDDVLHGKFLTQSAAGLSDPTTATALDPNRAVLDGQEKPSESIYAPTARGVNNESAEVPPPPDIGVAKYFECPYCMILCSKEYTGKKTWRSHVFHDLRPYVCTYEECPQGDRLFESRGDWIHHENSSHRKIWRCIYHVNETFANQIAYEDHLQLEHSLDVVESQSSALIRASESSSMSADRPCPFCLAKYENASELHLHIAYHLEMAALFALPRSHKLEQDVESGQSQARSSRVNAEDACSQDEDHLLSEEEMEGSPFSDLGHEALRNEQPMSHLNRETLDSLLTNQENNNVQSKVNDYLSSSMTALPESPMPSGDMEYASNVSSSSDKIYEGDYTDDEAEFDDGEEVDLANNGVIVSDEQSSSISGVQGNTTREEALGNDKSDHDRQASSTSADHSTTIYRPDPHDHNEIRDPREWQEIRDPREWKESVNRTTRLLRAQIGLETSEPDQRRLLLDQSALCLWKLRTLQKQVDAIPDESGYVKRCVEAWNRANEKVKKTNEENAHKRKEDEELHIDEIINSNQMSDADMAVMEEYFKLAEAERKYQEDHQELQSFTDSVYNLVSERILETQGEEPVVSPSDDLAGGSGTPGGESVRGSDSTEDHIFTAVWSSACYYELEVNGTVVMRRIVDSWLNANQILEVAGVDKREQTKILEMEILNGKHENFKGGHRRCQGIWIDYHRGVEFSRQHGVYQLLRPLLEYNNNISDDGAARVQHGEVQTEKHPLAVKKERMYTGPDSTPLTPSSTRKVLNLTPSPERNAAHEFAGLQNKQQWPLSQGPMSFLPWNIAEAVAKATDENFTQEYWALLIEICNFVIDTGAIEVINAMISRLAHCSAHIQLCTLDLANVLSRRCGIAIDRELASETFTSTLLSLVRDRTTQPEVRSRVLQRMQHWTMKFADNDELRLMGLRFDSLRSEYEDLLTPKPLGEQDITSFEAEQELPSHNDLASGQLRNHVPAPQSEELIGSMPQKAAGEAGEQIGSSDPIAEWCLLLSVSKNTRLPQNFIRELEKRLIRVLVGNEKRPEYKDVAVKRSFAIFLNALSDQSWKGVSERNGRPEDLVLVFFADATDELQKGKPPPDCGVRRMIDRHTALFVALMRLTLEEQGWIDGKPELHKMLKDFERELLGSSSTET